MLLRCWFNRLISKPHIHLNRFLLVLLLFQPLRKRIHRRHRAGWVPQRVRLQCERDRSGARGKDYSLSPRHGDGESFATKEDHDVITTDAGNHLALLSYNEFPVPPPPHRTGVCLLLETGKTNNRWQWDGGSPICSNFIHFYDVEFY